MGKSVAMAEWQRFNPYALTAEYATTSVTTGADWQRPLLAEMQARHAFINDVNKGIAEDSYWNEIHEANEARLMRPQRAFSGEFPGRSGGYLVDPSKPEFRSVRHPYAPRRPPFIPAAAREVQEHGTSEAYLRRRLQAGVNASVTPYSSPPQWFESTVVMKGM